MRPEHDDVVAVGDRRVLQNCKQLEHPDFIGTARFGESGFSRQPRLDNGDLATNQGGSPGPR